MHQLPAIIPPPTEAIHEPFLAPAPASMPAQPGGAVPTPRSSVPGSFALPGVSPANGPSGSVSAALPLAVNPLNGLVFSCFLFLFLEFLM